MAVQELNRRPVHIPGLAFWLAAALAATLSLAAALVGLRGGDSAPAAGTQTSANEFAARNQRIAFFEARAAADPIDFTSLNVLASQYLQRARETGDVADYKRAEMAAARSVEVIPVDNYSGLFYLASVRLVQHDYAGALALAQRDIDLKPNEPSAYGVRGDALFGLGRYDEAADAYTTMVGFAADLPSLSRLANVSMVRGDVTNSIDFWKQSLTPAQTRGLPLENVAWADTQLSILYLSKGDVGRAEAEVKAALKTYPDYVHALAAMGAVRAAQGRWDESISYYTRAIEKLPQPQYVSALGDAYAYAGRPAEAESQYALVEAIGQIYQANGINTDLQLATFYSEHDRGATHALELAEASYKEAPSVYAADALAWALYKNGRLEEADARATEAMRLHTPEAGFIYHAAAIRYAMGDREAATRLLKQTKALNPTYLPLQTDAARRMSADLGVR